MLQLAVPANQLEASHGQVTRIKMMTMVVVTMVKRIKIKQIEMITLAKLTLASSSKI